MKGKGGSCSEEHEDGVGIPRLMTWIYGVKNIEWSADSNKDNHHQNSCLESN